jgi:hypothetical protein
MQAANEAVIRRLITISEQLVEDNPAHVDLGVGSVSAKASKEGLSVANAR